jgi:hypothetical protein
VNILYRPERWFNENGYRSWYGRAWPQDGIAVVRSDLSRSEKQFVEYHERQHLKDGDAGTMKSEFKANLKALTRHPVGAAKLLFRALREGHKLDIPDVDIDIRVAVPLWRW